MIRKLAHLCLVTDQLETLADFYLHKLGFTRQFTFRNTTTGAVFGHYLNCGDTTHLELFDRLGRHAQWGTGEPPTLSAGIQMNHICFEVTDLPAFRVLLESRGVKLTPITTGLSQSTQMWTQDPDGNPIEFLEYNARSWQLGPPREEG